MQLRISPKIFLGIPLFIIISFGFVNRCYPAEKKDSAQSAEITKFAKVHKLAAAGNAEAQYRIGVIYENGDGVPKDMKKAVEWYQKAAEQGNAAAQYSLGACYLKGDGVPKDINKAIEWAQKAAAQGNAAAKFLLELCYEIPEGVPADMNRAVEWYQKAAEQGAARAQFKFLASRIIWESTLPKQMSGGKRCLNRRKRQQSRDMHLHSFNIGLLYDQGDGVPKDTGKSNRVVSEGRRTRRTPCAV